MSGFPVPVAVVDKYIKLAGASQLKVLLYLLRHQAEGINIPAAADDLGLDIDEAEDALRFWVNAGIVLAKGDAVPKAEKNAPQRAVRPKTIKPSREEVARRGVEDPQIEFMLKEAEKVFGRFLRANEASSLVWLHDDEGLSAPIIIMLLEFASSEGNCNIGFIERTALKWVEKGVSTVSDAENEIKELEQGRLAWRQVQKAFGMEKRMPSANELALSSKWVYDYGYDHHVLHAAYEACVDSISKLDFKYIKGILDNWHKNGVKVVADIEKAAEPAKKPQKAKSAKKGSVLNTTDMDLAEKMLLTGGN